MHLKDLIQAAAITQDKRRKRLITCLKRAEELRHCYSLVRSITKPRQQGGLSHVNIPKETTPPAPPQWNAIYDPQELEQLVLQQHQTHFSQANGTIFTINPLRSLIDDECTSPFAQQERHHIHHQPSPITDRRRMHKSVCPTSTTRNSGH